MAARKDYKIGEQVYTDWTTGVEADERYENFGSAEYMLEKGKAAGDTYQNHVDTRSAMEKKIADMRLEQREEIRKRREAAAAKAIRVAEEVHASQMQKAADARMEVKRPDEIQAAYK